MKLATDECCYTCQHNLNNFKDNFPCDCELKSKNTKHTEQAMWCGRYDMVNDYDSKFE